MRTVEVQRCSGCPFAYANGTHWPDKGPPRPAYVCKISDSDEPLRMSAEAPPDACPLRLAPRLVVLAPQK